MADHPGSTRLNVFRENALYKCSLTSEDGLLTSAGSMDTRSPFNSSLSTTPSESSSCFSLSNLADVKVIVFRVSSGIKVTFSMSCRKICFRTSKSHDGLRNTRDFRVGELENHSTCGFKKRSKKLIAQLIVQCS